MTKDKVRQESLRLFARLGYENTSLTMIADAVGIKKPSLYNHFDNKDAIFLDVLHYVGDMERKRILEQAPELEGMPVKKQLHQFYRFYLERMAHSTEGLFFKRVTFFPPEKFTAEIKEVFLMVEDQMTTVIEPIMEKGIAEKKIRPLSTDTLTSAFYTLIDGLFLEENYYDQDVFEQRQHSSWEIFWLGIQTHHQEGS
ncbi:TetR family transcriptional regulator [Halobacillus litoralis]|uniref:TetR family transcriptional regulator n=1 Tax=Halobacillus litoralis TaxID=45668 RepID=A0A845DUC3_9BACI|nr:MULTISPECIES: TetR/AcrR family transcriptional regulator [Halobacillus]MCA1024091.1 TetR/AcrR family transcriptional regulator [Halobacillus litoralis]MYL21263.1 TetR family transcriptional regulator [Halobacillus litoralis]MYL30292.1 TetR family transcriptional regulator [Halobacillus halophilus]MYL38284.1 TetR family transcriptional regulator [Halobacillus litoralis]